LINSRIAVPRGERIRYRQRQPIAGGHEGPGRRPHEVFRCVTIAALSLAPATHGRRVRTLVVRDRPYAVGSGFSKTVQDELRKIAPKRFNPIPHCLAERTLVVEPQKSLDQRSNQAQEFLLLRSVASCDEKGSDLNVGDLST
jgi:hypothetical protein